MFRWRRNLSRLRPARRRLAKRRRAAARQPLHGFDVQFVELGRLRRLAHACRMSEARHPQKPAESGIADFPFADMPVSISTRAQFDLGVVEVKRTDPVETDVALHLAHEGVETAFRGKVVA